MLYDLSKRLGEILATRGAPYSVVYGPEYASGAGALVAQRVVIAPDGDDEIRPAPSRPVNPPLRYAFGVSGVCRVHAKSNRHGARFAEHEEEARSVAGLAVCALLKVASEYPSAIRFASGKLLTAADLQQRLGLDAPPVVPGVVYEIRFAIDRAIKDTAYTEAEIGGVGGVVIDTTDEIYLANHPDAAVAETAC